MNHRLASFSLLAFVTTGCIVIDDEPNGPCCDTPVNVNDAPVVFDGEAGCFWDRANRDDIWYFEAAVEDWDGQGDIIGVWADVYDEYDGTLVQSFELFPTNDPYVWYSDWLGRSTWMDCTYRGYTVDLVAYDQLESVGVLTLVPYVY
jgi:hypothetical protein